MKLEMSWEEFIPAVEKELGMQPPEQKFLGMTVRMLKHINLPNPAAAVMCTAGMLPKEGHKHYPTDDDGAVVVAVDAGAVVVAAVDDGTVVVVVNETVTVVVVTEGVLHLPRAHGAAVVSHLPEGQGVVVVRHLPLAHGSAPVVVGC